MGKLDRPAEPVYPDGLEPEARQSPEPRIAEPAAVYGASPLPAFSLDRLPAWMWAVPGFRSRNPWKMLVAAVAYLWILTRPQATGRAGTIFAVSALVGIAAYFDIARARSRLPLLKSASRSRRATGWMGLGAAAGLSLLATMPTPPTRTSPDSSVQKAAPASSARGSDGDKSSVVESAADRPHAINRSPTARSTPLLATKAGSANGMPVTSSSIPSREDATVSAPSTTPAPVGSPTPELYAVSQVVDGDTLKIVRGGTIETIRLIGIDTPEVGGNRTVVECFGQEASRMAAALLNGGRVRIELDPTQDERDEFGRLLAYVWLADGTFVNQKLVEDGYAYEYTYDQPYRYQREFRAAQAQARTGEAGLWSPSTCGGADTAAMLAEAPQAAPTAEVAEPPQAPPPAEVAPPQPQTGVVVISMIHYDGDEPRSEGDEYAQITNSGGSAVNLGGWRLNAGDPGQDFVFPSFELQPGASCRVYTNQTNGDSCGGTFGSGQARWNNDGDCGYLFDSSNQQVSEWCY